MTPDTLIAAARECLDTPFAHQGRLPGQALDCAGVAVHVARSLGLQPEEPAAYGRLPHDTMLEAWLERQPFLERVALATMRGGDLLLMRFKTEPQHLAVFTGKNIIHAYEAVGRVVEHGLDPKWSRRIVKVYRFKEPGNE